MQRDYVIGCFLPTLFDSARDDAEKAYEFTKAEAENLRFAGLPVRINHADGGDMVIGRVEAAYVHPGSREATALLSIEHGPNARPDSAYARTFASNAVASGVYGGLSLQHAYDSDLVKDGLARRLVVEKTPLEISLCRQGARPDTHITHFFPCRATLERLQRDGALEETLARHRLLAAGTVAKSDVRSKSYITDLEREISKQCAQAVLDHRFDIAIRSDHLRTGRVMASKDAPPADQSTMDVDPPAQQQQQQQQQQKDAPSSSVATPPTQTSVATEIITPDIDRIKLMEQLEQQQRETLQLRERLAKQAELEAQLAEFNKRETERKQKEEEQKRAEIERRRLEGEQHLRSVRELMRTNFNYSEAQTADETRELERQLQTDPLVAAENLRTMSRVLVKASNDQVAQERRALELQKMKAEVSNENAATLKMLSDRINANRSSLAFNSPTFSSAVGGAPIAGGLATQLEMPAPTPVPQKGTVLASASSPNPSASSATGMQSSPAQQVDPTNPRALFDAAVKQGRTPSYAEIAMGGIAELPSGRRMMSADGQLVEVVERRPRFDQPRHFGFQEFVKNADEIIAACARNYKRSDAMRMDAAARQTQPASFFSMM